MFTVLRKFASAGLNEARADRPRLDDGDANARPGKLETQRVTQGLERELRGAIGTAIERRDDAQHGGALHDAPLPCRRMAGRTRRVSSCAPMRFTSNCPAENVGCMRSSTAPTWPNAPCVERARTAGPRFASGPRRRKLRRRAGSARSRCSASTPSSRSRRSRSAPLRALASTRQPRVFMRRAEASPIPDEAPVTRSVRCFIVGAAIGRENTG